MKITTRRMKENDAPIMSKAFTDIGGNKPLTQYKKYYSEQYNGQRVVLLAFLNNEFAGYVTIVWKPNYPYFRENNIPEIIDLNILPQFKRKKVATKLMDKAENLVAERSDVVGIGVGLSPDYNAAQKMYVLRGYVSDGCGIVYQDEYIKGGQKVVVDDDLVLHFTKQLK